MDHRKEKLCATAEEIRMTVERFPRLGLTADLAHLGLTGADIGSFISGCLQVRPRLNFSVGAGYTSP